MPAQYLWIHRRFKGLDAGLSRLLRLTGRRRAGFVPAHQRTASHSPRTSTPGCCRLILSSERRNRASTSCSHAPRAPDTAAIEVEQVNRRRSAFVVAQQHVVRVEVRVMHALRWKAAIVAPIARQRSAAAVPHRDRSASVARRRQLLGDQVGTIRERAAHIARGDGRRHRQARSAQFREQSPFGERACARGARARSNDREKCLAAQPPRR